MSTLNKGLVSDVLQIVSDYRGETSTDTSAVRIRAVSRQEQSLAKRKLWRLFSLKDQTTAGDGTNDYTIGSASYPYRPKGLSELFVNGTTEDKRYAVVDFQTYKNLYNRSNANLIAYEWYDAANDLWKMHINPAPAVGKTITYSYFWLPPVRTASSDPVYYLDIEALARFALAEIFEGEDEQDRADAQRSLAEQILADDMGWENTPAVGQTYAMGAWENSIRSRGIGSY